MLRKTRNFAMSKFDAVPAHQEQAAISEWAEVVTKPPPQPQEAFKPQWVVAALHEGGS
eukprot:COSAG02_NODE_56856_length_283_cov_0.853261_1_plen_58_part_00